MSITNWKVIKNEYETLGTGIKELASSHHTTEALVRAAIKEGDWKIEDADSTSTTDLSAKLANMGARHQAELVPKFIALQGKMLEKCDMLLDSVESLDDAGQLKVVSEVIEKHRPAIMSNQEGSGADKDFTIRIVNKVGDGADVSVNAVEITASAGATNGLGVPHGTPIH